MKLKKNKAQQVQLDSATIQGDMKPVAKKPSYNVKKLLPIAVIVLVVISSVFLYLVLRTNNTELSNEEGDEPVQIDPSVVAVVSVDTFTAEQLADAVAKTGDPKTNINEARVKAAALEQLNNSSAAIIVHEQINAAGTGTYEDTVTYAFAVLNGTGDYKKAIELLQQAKTQLQGSSVLDDVKKSYGEYIDNKIIAIQRDAEL
jgi:hypothetical protein